MTKKQLILITLTSTLISPSVFANSSQAIDFFSPERCHQMGEHIGQILKARYNGLSKEQAIKELRPIHNFNYFLKNDAKTQKIFRDQINTVYDLKLNLNSNKFVQTQTIKRAVDTHNEMCVKNLISEKTS